MNWNAILDILCVLIIAPIAPFTIVWFLPWERWVFERIPPRARKFLGPYFICLSFAAWHFKFHLWAVAITGVGGFIVTLTTLFGRKEESNEKPNDSN